LFFGLYVGFHTDVLSNNFNNVEASRTVLNGDGSITVVTGMFGCCRSDNHKLFVFSDAWNNVTFIAGDLRNNKKEYTTKFISGYFDCHRYLYPGKLAYLALLPMHGTGASDIAGNGIMFASNDQ
jgi:APA family basic amino acid/polyamine antiporter